MTAGRIGWSFTLDLILDLIFIGTALDLVGPHGAMLPILCNNRRGLTSHFANAIVYP
jgi:hypothetical protein